MPIKLTILVAVVLSSIMYWSLSNICRFNYSVDKKTKILNELAKEAQIDFGSAKVYYFKELNCLPANNEYAGLDVSPEKLNKGNYRGYRPTSPARHNIGKYRWCCS